MDPDEIIEIEELESKIVADDPSLIVDLGG